LPSAKKSAKLAVGWWRSRGEPLAPAEGPLPALSGTIRTVALWGAIWLVPLAFFVLREPLGPLRIGAALVGFAGVLVMLQPGAPGHGFGWGQAAALGAGTIAFAGDPLLGHEMHLAATAASLRRHSLFTAFFPDSRHQRGDWFIAKTAPERALLAMRYTPAELDREDEANYWRRYVETRTKIAHFRLKRLTPTLTTWDDHDFGKNNADRRFRQKDLTKEIFEIFWANQETPILKKV
jgi:hypothetical protein